MSHGRYEITHFSRNTYCYGNGKYEVDRVKAHLNLTKPFNYITDLSVNFTFGG